MEQTKEDTSISGRNSQHGIAKRFDLKKIKKPLLERKRRERINRALAHLKTLILDNIRLQGGTQTAKLDKADILEMTVNYLSLVHYGQNIVSMATDKFLYSNGYQRCSTDAMAYLTTFAQPEVTQVTVSGDFAQNEADDVMQFSAEGQSSVSIREPVNSLIEETKYSPSNVSESDDSVCRSSTPTEGSKGDVSVCILNVPSMCQEDMSPNKSDEDRTRDNDNNEAAVWRPW